MDLTPICRLTPIELIHSVLFNPGRWRALVCRPAKDIGAGADTPNLVLSLGITVAYFEGRQAVAKGGAHLR
jgi:hypothetical protein